MGNFLAELTASVKLVAIPEYWEIPGFDRFSLVALSDSTNEYSPEIFKAHLPAPFGRVEFWSGRILSGQCGLE